MADSVRLSTRRAHHLIAAQRQPVNTRRHLPTGAGKGLECHAQKNGLERNVFFTFLLMWLAEKRIGYI